MTAITPLKDSPSSTCKVLHKHHLPIFDTNLTLNAKNHEHVFNLRFDSGLAHVFFVAFPIFVWVSGGSQFSQREKHHTPKNEIQVTGARTSREGASSDLQNSIQQIVSPNLLGVNLRNPPNFGPSDIRTLFLFYVFFSKQKMNVHFLAGYIYLHAGYLIHDFTQVFLERL